MARFIFKWMQQLFDYLNYSQFLKDYFVQEKGRIPFFSYRYFAGKLNIDGSNLHKIIEGKQHPSRGIVQKLSSYFNFSDKQQEFFQTLVDFAKAKSKKDSEYFFNKLSAIKSVEQVKVETTQYDFYKKWYHTAIFNLLECFTFEGDYKQLGSQLTPPITEKQAKESIDLLLHLKFIKKTAAGKYIHLNKALTTKGSGKDLALKNFHMETAKLAIHSLNNHPNQDREMSSLSVSVSKSAYEQIKMLTHQYRQSIVKLVSENTDAERVYTINVQIFPLSKRQK